jgi:hypothetical protein
MPFKEILQIKQVLKITFLAPQPMRKTTRDM